MSSFSIPEFLKEIDVGALKCCVREGYRKCAALAALGYVDACYHYDDYGSGIEGIKNYLQKNGVKVYPANVSGCVMTERGLACYLSDAGASAVVALLSVFLSNWYLLPKLVETFRDATISARTVEALVELLRRRPVNVAAFLSNPLSFASLSDVDEFDKTVKQLIVEGRLYEARNLIDAAILWLTKKDMLDKDFVEQLLKCEGVVGMELMILHERLLSSLVAGMITPENWQETLKIVRTLGKDNRLAVIADFLEHYFATVQQIWEHEGYKFCDYEKINARISGNTVYLRLGAHHAKLTFHSGTIVLEYGDHNEYRVQALAEFLRKIGFEVQGGGGFVKATVPVGRMEELAKVLAATTSADLLKWEDDKECIDVFEEAASIEELMKLRLECYDGDDDEW